jgi:hypothetical protein
LTLARRVKSPDKATAGGDMIKREYAAVTAVIGAAAGLSLVVKVWAGAEKAAFPENYASGVKYQVVDKPRRR